MAPILPPPMMPPHVASVQAPAQQAPAAPAAPTRFKDLNPSQARWLEILEKHGILRTNPTSQLFGPDQAVHRDEMLMSESRLVELILRRDQEQQVLIDRLKDELAELRAQQAPLVALPIPALKPAAIPIAPPPTFTLAAEPIQLPPSLSAKPDRPIATSQPVREPYQPALMQEVEEPVPLAIHTGQSAKAATLLTTTDVQVPEPMTARADKPEAVSTPRTVEVVRTSAPANIDLSSIVRHRNRLRQFPYLHRFLDKAAYLDPTSNNYCEYVQTYLASAGMTTGMLAEAARQAAWFDTQSV